MCMRRRLRSETVERNLTMMSLPLELSTRLSPEPEDNFKWMKEETWSCTIKTDATA
jgi:hypothetical protein